MAATNRPEALDEAVRRRFARRILIPLPDVESRLALICRSLDQHGGPVDVPQAVREEIARATEGYSSADVEKICQAAGQAAVSARERSLALLQITCGSSTYHHSMQLYFVLYSNCCWHPALLLPVVYSV